MITLGCSHATDTDTIDLQQTPATNPKASLKLVTKPAEGRDTDSYVFTFTSATDARSEQGQITGILRDAIASLTSHNVQAVRKAQPNPSAQAGQTSNTNVRPVSALIKPVDSWYDDNNLKNDAALQRSLLEADPMLLQRFTESSRDRPESITVLQFSLQFWSSRLHLLRAHAIEKAQNQSDYNVLPEIKERITPAQREGEPDTKVLELSADQIKLLFKQYPVIRMAYNDNVPKINAGKFWNDFFNSRLLKKLRGHRLTDQDKADPIFDKYLDYREAGPATNIHIPHFIDLEGNEQNHSQKKGNQPEAEMRPGTHEKVPILRMLNGLSDKLLSAVAPSDGEAHAPVGLDEEAYDQLQLRDLQAYDGDNRVKLNIADQKQFLSQDSSDQLSADAIRYSNQSPAHTLAKTRAMLDFSTSPNAPMTNVDLAKEIGGLDDSDDSDDEADVGGDARPTHAVGFGKRSALTAASVSMCKSLHDHKSEEPIASAATFGLSQGTFDELTMTQHTTIEFLHFFWTLYLSGDGARTGELAGLIETLDKSTDSIQAVGKRAEDERSVSVKRIDQQIQSARDGSAKRRRLELELERLGGGDKAVRKIMAPTIQALSEATRQYRVTYEAQTAAASV